MAQSYFLTKEQVRDIPHCACLPEHHACMARCAANSLHVRPNMLCNKYETSYYDGRQYTQVCEKQSTAVQRLCPIGMFLFFELLCPGKGGALQPLRL